MTERRGRDRRVTHHDHLMTELKGFDNLRNHAELEANGAGKLLAVEFPAKVEDFQDQVLDGCFRKPGFCHGFRFGRSGNRKCFRHAYR